MPVFDVYGSDGDLDSVRIALEDVLSLRFEERESDYYGGRYFSFDDTAGEHFVLKRNIDPIDGQPADLAFPDHATLLYVSYTERLADLREVITSSARTMTLLRHEDL